MLQHEWSQDKVNVFKSICICICICICIWYVPNSYNFLFHVELPPLPSLPTWVQPVWCLWRGASIFPRAGQSNFCIACPHMLAYFIQVQDVVQYAMERGIQVAWSQNASELLHTLSNIVHTLSHILHILSLIVTYCPHIIPLQVIPELDAPAHVGAGWEAAHPDFTTCVNKEPWTDW